MSARFPGWACAAVLAGVIVAACGGGGGSDKAAISAPASDPFVKQSATAAKIAAGGVVWGKSTGFIDPGELSASNAGAVAPLAVKPDGKPRTVIYLGQGPTGDHHAIATILQNIGKRLGWDVTATFSDFTPVGYQRQFAAAIQRKPDAIVAGATPATLVAAQLAQARQQGITTLTLNDAGAGGPGYEHYVPGGFNLEVESLAAKIVADSGGKANVVWIDPGQALATLELSLMGKYLERCGGCKVTREQTDAGTTNDPVKSRQYMTSLLRKRPDAQYIVWPYAEPNYGPALQALKASGNTNAKLVSLDANPVALQAVRSGDSPFVASFPLTPTILQAADVLMRVFAGEKDIPAVSAWTGATSLWVRGATDLPTGGLKGIESWTASHSGYDYLGAYGKAWGVDLSGIFDGVPAT